MPYPACGPKDVVIEVEACGICGTDVHAYRHGATQFAAPGQVLGHEFAGSVVEVGAGIGNVSVGDRVTAWPIVHCDSCASCLNGDWHLCTNALGHSVSSGVPGAFAEFVRIPSARLGRTLYQLPEEVDWLTGALVEPMSVGLRAAGFASVRAGETVLVTGLGPIGLCVVQALSLTGARVVGIDPSARRRVAAIELGAGRVLEPQEDIADDLYDVAPSGFDAVCECSGSDRALVQALEAVRPGGTVVLVGLFGRTLSLAPDPILTKEVRLQGVYAYRTEYARAISLFATGQLRASPLISHRLPLERIADAFAIQANPESGVKVMVVPRADPRDRTRRD